MPIGSYCGRILKVDLTTGKTETSELDPKIARDFIGDIGINLKLAYDLLKPGTDPLSPSNVIILGAGPLVGTSAPSAARSSVLTKYPHTGAIAFASVGMNLGRRLKYAGYDHLIVIGRADQPVYLKIWDDDIEICDAKHLWGKDIFQTTDELWEELGKKYSIVAMGQAGENLVEISLALADKISTVGKGGLPAVMGSKNLKAIAVGGTKRVKVSDPERYAKTVTPLKKELIEDPERKNWIEKGKMRVFEPFLKKGRLTYKNWTVLYPAEEGFKRYGIEEYFKVRGKRVGCPGCPYPCKDILQVREGKFQGLTTNVSSSIGRMLDLGVRCGGGNWPEVTKLLDMANRYGIDTHSFSPTMNLAVELYERGIITKEDTDGLVLKRDFETTAELLEKTAFRQGIGDTLADGSKGLIKRFGSEVEKYSYTIKDLEVHGDLRMPRFMTLAMGELTQPEGASEEASAPYYGEFWKADPTRPYSLDLIRAFCKQFGVPEEAMPRIVYEPEEYSPARLTKYIQNFYIMITALGICNYRTEFMDMDKFSELYSAATGIEMSPADIVEASDRIWNLFKAINVREGFSRKDDKIPIKTLEPVRTSTGEEIPVMDYKDKPLSADDIERMLDDYYDERGWEVERGIPTKEKLMDLGLSNVVRDFEKQGIFK